MRNLLDRVILALLLPINFSYGQTEWPQFRGSTGQGIAGKAPQSWGMDQGVAWKMPLEAHGWSSPVISEDRIVMTGSTGDGKETRLHVFALDVETGKTIWSEKLFTPTDQERRAKHAKNTFASSTPLIHEGIVYAHFGHMGTAAMKLDTGKLLWKTKFEYEPKHGGASSLLMAEGKLIFSADGETMPMLVALHPESGKVAWKTPRTEEARQKFSFSTPLLVENKGRKEIISPASGMVGAYDPTDGRQLWKMSYDVGFSVVPRPVEMNGMIFISTGFMKPQLLAIKLENAEGDVTESHLEWSVKRFIPKTPSFVATDGVLYVLDDTGSVSCIDAGDGSTKWKEKLIGNFSASPVLADDALYCMTEDGVCYVMKVSPERGEVVMELDIEQRILASPAVVDGGLFIRTETHLWKITG
ncbi:PQQ-binding-like beta-propeller repeat protein [Haloferula sp.]|uniref:outer membrane protein assembly factor BamB family protein n=1 Tax=Haloferula sp. TaxID=2497595 RepID=UPI003C74B836